MSKPEGRVLIRRKPDGRSEISVVDVHNGKECRTGLTVHGERAVEKTVQHLMNTLERSGSRATVKEM